MELREDALAEFGGGLAGEGDGEDFFGLGDAFVGEELEVALHEEAGFAGAGGGFDDPGGVYVERLFAGGVIGCLRGVRAG